MNWKPVSTAVLILAALAAASLSRPGSNARDEDPLKAADKAFADQTYSEALEGYRAVEKNPKYAADRDRVVVRIGRCLDRLNRPDEALDVLGARAAETPESRGARFALIERGVLTLTMPHHYYEKDGKRTRGQWIQGGKYVWTEQDDYFAGTADLEDARRRGERARAKGGDAWTDADVTEHVRGLLELAAGLEYLAQRDAPIKPERTDATDAAYGARTKWLDRMCAAFDLAVASESARKNAAGEAYALYLKSGALRRTLGSHRKTDGGFEIPGDGVPSWTALPADRDPVKVMETAREKARGLPAEDSFVFGLATTRLTYDRFVDSVASFRELAENFPKSKFLGDAKSAIEQITFPRLTVNASHAVAPDRPFVVEGLVRNAPEALVELFKFDAAALWLSERFLDDADLALESVPDLLKSSGWSPSGAARFVSSTLPTGDDGTHRYVDQKFALPALPRGQYLLRVEAGRLVRLALVTVSDLAVVTKVDDERTLVYVADGPTGLPVKGADVVVRERWSRSGLFGTSMVERHLRGTTDADGLFSAPHRRMAAGDSSTMETVVVDGPRAALAPSQHRWIAVARGRRDSMYVVTDRPVYRPGDTVRLAALATSEIDGRHVPTKNEVFGVEVRDAKNERVFNQELRTDADGAFHLELALGKEPPLGEYSATIRRGKRHVRRATFAVEEYLKPEFSVSISAPPVAVRLGEKAKATIVAEYYMGGGVAGGEATWSVLRRAFRPSFRRSEPWRHLYGGPTEDLGPARDATGEEVVATGSGALNSDGRFELEFDTAAWRDVEGEGSTFAIQAEVTDSSRRTISAEDVIVVPKRALALDLSVARGFYSAGETVEVEMQSVLPSGAAVAASGVVKTAKLTPKPGVREGSNVDDFVRAEIHEEPAATDEKGVGFFRTTFDEGGYYSVRFEARDAFEQLCFAEIRFWVRAPGFRADGFEMKNLELTAERRTWKRGETARVLIHANLADCAVLFTVEAGRKILGSKVVRLNGKTALLELPILDEHAPNVFLRAVTVRDGGFFSESLELFVPPIESFVTADLKFERDEFRPGAEGDLVLTTSNFKGEPVSARAFVTVLDASLFYIRNDATPDMRRNFYGDRRGANVGSGVSGSVRYGVYAQRETTFGRYDTVGSPPAWHAPAGTATMLLERGLAALNSDEFLGAWGFADGRGQKRSRGGQRGLFKEDAAVGSTMAPASEAAPEDSARMSDLSSESGESLRRFGGYDGDAGLDKESPPAGIRVRTDFRDSAFWSATVRTDATGRAVLKVPFPESTTRWRAKAWTWTPDMLVGEGTADARTTQNLVVRLRAPRFFVEGDVVVVAASVNNRGAARGAEVSLDLPGDGSLATDEPLRKSVSLAAGGVSRAEWRVRVLRAGDSKLTVRAWSGDEADGMEQSFPVYPWGADKRLFDGAVLDAGAARTLAFDIPAARRAETTAVRVVVRPSLALTLLDALPYLIEYPYGCTEQTVSRFVPAAVVARTLREAGTTLDEIAKKRAALPRAEAQGAGRERRVDDHVLNDVVRSGLARLRQLQHADGGYGWWKDGDSDVYMTSYVVQGLLIARDADVAFDQGLLSGALGFLKKALKTERRLETAAFAACMLAKAGEADAETTAKIYASRDTLSLYGKALLASALHAGGKAAEAKIVVRAFEDFIQRDEANATAHWGYNGGGWWHWWHSRFETNAAILHALLDVDPAHKDAAPLAKWLALNRRGNRWTNTRDTAHAVFALVRFAKSTGELDPDMEVVVTAGGTSKTFKIDRRNMFAYDDSFVLEGAAVPSGPLKIETTTKGRGRAYVAAEARFFTQEAEISSAGRELFVERSYAKVVKESKEVVVDGRSTAVVSERFEPLEPGAALLSGDVVEVRLKIESKNDYEHLLFEDMKPAGFEPVEVRSGARYAGGIASHVEFRDEKTALFATWLEQGTHELAYRLRAEIPGTLRAAPARGEAMYAPDVGGTSSSFRFEVRDRDVR